MSQGSLAQLEVRDPAPVESPVRLQQPLLSVIVPVYNGAPSLPASLNALEASDLPRTCWELIVVDDGSLDQSAEVASRSADRVLRLGPGPRGPAFARNRGAAIARGAVLVFVDADVCVHPDALRRVLETLDGKPDVSAVFGAYDAAPTAGGLISQYRNLLHRYVHQREAGDAVTFWAGIGAIRSAAFARSGGFDETEYLKPSVEDIELGYRLSALGHRIVLCPEIQGRHLKHWTLRSMINTDVRRRGIPWVRLLLKRKLQSRATLNIRPSEQVCTVLVVVGCVALGHWVWSGGMLPALVALTMVVAVVGIEGPLLAWFARHRGWWFALQAIPLRFLYHALNAVSVSLALLPAGWAGRISVLHDGRS